jgi:hypothetical protein
MLHPQVIAELEERLPASDRRAAQTLLESTSLPFISDISSVAAARIHMAAIKLGGGSADQLRSILVAAATDWRDVLVAAGMANADWEQVLETNGFRVPR